jgi:hypothetical protein
MDRVEKIMQNYPELKVEYLDMGNELGGYIYRNHIMLNKNMTENELVPILYEEIGHYKTTVGNISKYSTTADRQQERRARVWGITHFISKKDIERFKKCKYDNDYEVADELGVTVPYLHEVGEVYQSRPYL